MQQFHFHKQLHPLRRERVPTGLFPAGLAAWLRIADVREQRRHLGGHAVDGKELQLVRPDLVPGTRLAWQLERDAAVLQRVGSGGTLSDAYVDVYGGFAKDLPRWLLAVERSLGALLDHPAVWPLARSAAH